MKKVYYKVCRPAFIGKELSVGDTIMLFPRAAQFLLADGTLEPVKRGKKSASSTKDN